MPALGHQPHANQAIALRPRVNLAEDVVEIARRRCLVDQPAGAIGVGPEGEAGPEAGIAQSWRSISIFLISAIARAGDRPLGQTLAQFMIVWQR